MLKKLRAGLLALGALIAVANAPAHAAGMWFDWPGIGFPSYCAAIVGSSNVQSGQTGQGTGGTSGIGQNGVYCAQTVPAGPVTFAGTEYLPLDLGPLGGVTGAVPSSATVSLLQLGQGPVIDSVATGAAVTIPNGTGFFVLDTGTPATVVVTLPAAAVEGQFVHLVCKAAVGTALSVAANSGQTLVGASPATCAAGTPAGTWRFVAPATGLIAAGTWLRVQ
jgi:hypothetical protein